MSHVSIFALTLFVISFAGCQSANHAQRNAVLGSALGGTTGAIIGHQSGQTAEGGLIGAAAGAVTGGLVGNVQDANAERDAVVAQASHVNQVPALTNQDLVQMAQSGLGDTVIINAIQQRGGQFDLSPQGLIFLKSNGVSDAVIQDVQRSSTSVQPNVVKTRPDVVAPYVSGVVVVRPQPIARVYVPAARFVPRYVPRHFVQRR